MLPPLWTLPLQGRVVTCPSGSLQSHGSGPVAWWPSPHGWLRLGSAAANICRTNSVTAASARAMAAPGLCPPRAGLVHYRLRALVITRQAQIGIKCGACVAKPSSSPLRKSWGLGGKVLPGQLEREGEAAREERGLMLLETLVFIFPPGSLGSRGGQGRIPQES